MTQNDTRAGRDTASRDRCDVGNLFCPCSHALGEDGNAVNLLLNQKHDEFLAAHATGKVGTARAISQDLGKATQNLVTDIMSPCVVDAFELVEIKGNQRQADQTARSSSSNSPGRLSSM